MIIRNKQLNQIRLKIAMAISLAFAILFFFPYSILGNTNTKNNNIILAQKSFNTKQKPQQKPAKETKKNIPIVHIGNTGVKTCFDIEKEPEFKGGKVAMLKFLKDKMNYPVAANKSGFQGTVDVQFVVEETGKISRVKILRGFDNACDEEAMRLVKSMPNWIPGRMNGQAVPSIFQIPIKFQGPKLDSIELVEPPSDDIKPYYDDNGDQIFFVVDQNPKFKGGYQAMAKYLTDNMNYPPKAKESGIHGTVFVMFVIDKTGKIFRVKLIRGIGGGCDEEALRLIREMPNWNPGRQKGQAVSVMFQIPVKFQLK